jgi:DNA polymerase III alpha subunit (gram-positive type)
MGAVGGHGVREATRATVYLDLETTGLYPPADEILEITVVDHGGQVLLETLVRPEHMTSWPDAEALHGITPQDVESAPTLETLHPQIVEVVRGNTVVLYNAAFDRGFREAELAVAAEVRCCMIAFRSTTAPGALVHARPRPIRTRRETGETSKDNKALTRA